MLLSSIMMAGMQHAKADPHYIFEKTPVSVKISVNRSDVDNSLQVFLMATDDKTGEALDLPCFETFTFIDPVIVLSEFDCQMEEKLIAIDGQRITNEEWKTLYDLNAHARLVDCALYRNNENVRERIAKGEPERLRISDQDFIEDCRKKYFMYLNYRKEVDKNSDIFLSKMIQKRLA